MQSKVRIWDRSWNYSKDTVECHKKFVVYKSNNCKSFVQLYKPFKDKYPPIYAHKYYYMHIKKIFYVGTSYYFKDMQCLYHVKLVQYQSLDRLVQCN